MSAAATCKHCGCSEIDSDPSRGNAVCTSCGAVLEESIIVSEVTFEEDGHGGASAVGQFVAADSRGGGGYSGPGGYHQGFGKESREQTLRQAKKKIEEVAGNLRLHQHHVDKAHNFFKMALHKQLTKGRKNLLTIAACVYITCRVENTPHLLIDFSDVVQMDVYSLGRAYLQLSRALYIKIPAADPCLYILRFAHNFNLGDKTQTVANTAMRLIERMKKDWIHLGRRPSGLCGAALLIAARLHDFKRTVQDIIQIVKVHETTLRKRLVEFGETPSSALTMEEFMQVDLEEQHDPPSFKAAREKDKLEMQRVFEDMAYNKELTQLRKEIDEELDKRQAKAQEKAEMMKNVAGTVVDGGREEEDTSKFINESTLTTISEIIERDETDATSVSVHVIEENKVFHVLGPVKPDQSIDAIFCDKDRMLMPPPDRRPSQEELEAAGIGILEKEVENIEEDESLDDIDDDEISGYIMNEHEVRSKTKLWEELNKEYLEQQEQKQAQKKLTPKEAKAEKQKQKKKGNQKQAETSSVLHQAANAGDAVMILLKERSQSSKINYDVLKNLGAYNIFDHAPTPSPMPTPSPGFIQKDEDDTKNFITIGSGAIVAKRRSSQISEGPGSPMKKTKSKKPRVCDIKPEPSGSMTKVELHLRHGEISFSSSARADDDVVVESGPVAYEAAAYAESDDEEDQPVSASQLLNRFRGEDNDDEYDDYD